jgi:gas vesicle protein
MQEERDTIRTSLIIPFLVGGLVGAGIALLLAPKSGRAIRSDMKEYASRTKNSLMSAIDEGAKLYEDGKAAVANAVEAGKSTFRQEQERHQRAA